MGMSEPWRILRTYGSVMEICMMLGSVSGQDLQTRYLSCSDVQLARCNISFITRPQYTAKFVTVPRPLSPIYSLMIFTIIASIDFADPVLLIP